MASMASELAMAMASELAMAMAMASSLRSTVIWTIWQGPLPMQILQDKPESWPEDQEELLDHGADDLAFLLDHFSPVLTRNGVNTEMAKEEFVGLKLLIARMFKDQTYLSLWDLMLTREPYCSDYKHILHLVHILLVLPLSSAGDFPVACFNRRPSFTTRVHLGGHHPAPFAFMAPIAALVVCQGPGLQTVRAPAGGLPSFRRPGSPHEPGV
ncbi:unnamed protein product [Gadus morhua 'NCC']